MQPHAAERRDLNRQIALARPIFLVLALVDLLELNPGVAGRGRLAFVVVYLAVATLIAVLDHLDRWDAEIIPLWVDIAAAAVFLIVTPSLVAFWFPYLFLTFAAAIRWGMKRAVILAGAATLALLVRATLWPPEIPRLMISLVPLVAGTFAAGAGLAYLGARQLRQAAEHEALARLTRLLQVEFGLAESLRRVMRELNRLFDTDLAILAFHDTELERLFVWKVRTGDEQRLVPENLPLEKLDSFLLDHPDATLAWNSMAGPGSGFGWNRHDGKRLAVVPRMPGPSRQELQIQNLAAATFEFAGQAAGRLLLCNRAGKFTPRDLRWLERILRHLAMPMENLFLLRHLRTRAIETERGRVSRDLHDTILQTMLGLGIQLDVLRRKIPSEPGQPGEELAALSQAVRREEEELRKFVIDLRPVHVESADLVDLMQGFAERFRAESTIALELLADTMNLQAPDRVCRELFQIYREALHNIKKHSRATHVVVKLWQDEARVSLVVDDNGQGFSFAGRFTSEELDRLRLGPISIKERVRGIGAVLIIESSPGHGARLTIEVPLS